MSTKEAAAKEAATANANLNTWGAVIALLESGLLSGPSKNYYKASSQIIKIAKAQMQADLARYDAAMACVKEP
jgi:hypothetical protein